MNDLEELMQTVILCDKVELLMLADAFEEAGRDREAALCRSEPGFLIIARSDSWVGLRLIDVLHEDWPAPPGYADLMTYILAMIVSRQMPGVTERWVWTI